MDAPLPQTDIVSARHLRPEGKPNLVPFFQCRLLKGRFTFVEYITSIFTTSHHQSSSMLHPVSRDAMLMLLPQSDHDAPDPTCVNQTIKTPTSISSSVRIMHRPDRRERVP